MNAKQEISALIRAADGDTRTALLRLAELLDEHMLACPHVEPPVARPTFMDEFRIDQAGVVSRYEPSSHDEQVMVDRAEQMQTLSEVRDGDD